MKLISVVAFAAFLVAPALGALGGADKCMNDADQAIWNGGGSDNFTSDMDTCGHKCYGAEQCVTDCVKDAEGYSDECSGCFGALADCTVKKCMTECMLGRSEKCDACVAENCNPGFTDCSGISDIPS
mmetsp:Transcript_31650/g.62760  ORF Transcript_31650/g.62760 Transcript_31650/m.62760 type:complete len:127 (+) Transcript_31650:58-438(+)